MISDKTNNVKVVVFDCDGVMFDTEQANRMYYNGILDHFGKSPMTQEQFEYSHMSTVNEAIAYLFSDRDNLDDVYKYYQTITYKPLVPYMEMEPCLNALLTKLKTKYSIAIATNRSTTMEDVISHHGLSGWFELIVTSLDVERPKPFPDQLEKIMKHFQIGPNEMFYIGDSKTDEKAAIQAGVIFAAYENTSLQADFHITSLKEVETILNI
jgi:phosphoglycolate phosphatase